MKVKQLLVGVMLLALLVTPALAQREAGTISGTVTDPAGAVVANARVTVALPARGFSRSTVTSDTGFYSFPGLLPGVYDITVESPGFATWRRQAQVTVDARVLANASLTVTAEEVVMDVISEGGVQVNVVNQTVGNFVSGAQISEMTTLNRNAYALVTLSGNVSPRSPDGRGIGVSIAGARAASTNVMIDGGENNDLFRSTVAQFIPLDAVQEFSVLTSNFTAEHGRASGGIVNLVTKSGGNTFHGSLFEFYRGSGLGSNSVDNGERGLKKSRYSRHQFGYSIGGPVVQDKLFFFNSSEWIRVRSSALQNVLVPMPAFIAASAAETQAFFGAYGQLGTPVNGPILTKADVNALLGAGQPTGAAWTALDPTTPILGTVNYTTPTNAGGGTPQNTMMFVNKMDWNATERTHLSGRYTFEKVALLPGANAHSPYLGYSTTGFTFYQNVMVSATRSWRPNLVSQTKLLYNRLNDGFPLGDRPDGPTLYFRDTTATTIGGVRIAGPGYLPFNPGSALPFGGPQNLYQITQDATWSKGRHQFRFGGLLLHVRDNRAFGALQNSVQALSTSAIGTAFNNFLAGRLARFQVAVDPQGKFPCAGDANNVVVVTPECTVTLPVGQPRFSRNNRYNDFALYAQDSWKIVPRVTLNLGVRWEYFGVQHNVDPTLDANFVYGPGDQFQRIRTGQAMKATDSPVGGLWGKDLNNFAPRVGFAWDVFGDGKTAIRGGYGMAYERNFGNVTFNVIQNPPNYAVLALLPTDVDTGFLPVYVENAGPLSGSGSKALPRVSLRHVDENIRTAYAHNWNITVERELGRSTVASASYIGSKGVKLYSLEDPNRPGSGVIYLGDDPTVATLKFGRMNRQYSNLNTRSNKGASDYHSVNIGLRANNLLNQGVMLTTNYTWAHAKDNLSDTFSSSGNNFNLGLLDPFNPNGIDRGNAMFDIRHRIVVGAVWELPYLKNTENPFLKWVASGWQLSPQFQAHSGSPFTMWDCTNGFVVCIPMIPNGAAQLTGSQGTRLGANNYQYIPITPANYTTYAHPVLGISDFGPFPAAMLNRNSWTTPGAWFMNLGVFKNFPISEGVRLQFRGEVFNVSNHANLWLNGGQAEVNSGGASVYRSYDGTRANNNRNIQIGARLSF